MRRTQIYLEPKVVKLLANLSTKTGKTRSELIREALSQVYFSSDVHEIFSKVKELKSFSSLSTREFSKLRTLRKWS